MGGFNAAEAEILMMEVIEPQIAKLFEGGQALWNDVFAQKWEFEDLLDLCEEASGKPPRKPAQEFDIDYEKDAGIRLSVWRQK